MKFEKLEPAPARPPLETGSCAKAGQVTTSIFTGAVVTTAVCGVLALLAVAVPKLLPVVETPPLAVTSVETQEEPTFNEVFVRPPVTPTAVPPPAVTAPKFVSNYDLPDAPVPEVFEMPEDFLDNPFANPEPEVTKPTKKPAPKVAKKTPRKTTPKKRTPTKAELAKAAARRAAIAKAKKAKAEARRIAALKGKIVRKATLVSRAKPTYPRSAKKKKHQGSVVVTVTIGTNGRVTAAQVTSSSNISSLDQAALKAARRHRFKPAVNGLGEAVATRKRIPFKFRLSS